jgi:FAD/FMN-containing dehydrogenase
MSDAVLMTLVPPPGFRGVFRTDAPARGVYGEAAGIARIMPAAVAVPADADDVVTLVRWAADRRVPLTPRGSGSSMANGAVGPGVIVDLARLDAIGPVRGRERRVTVGAAVIRDRVDEVARRSGLTFPVEPSSSAFATIGGMCATHAAGARQVKYGPLRDWVEGLECVFADGTRAWVRRGEDASAVPAVARFLREVAPGVRDAGAGSLRHDGVRKETSGYALAAWREREEAIDLILGSEGTLAVIVATDLRLTPLPGATASCLATFASVELAAAAATRIAGAGASAVELLDRTFLEIAAEEGEGPVNVAGADAVLLVEAEMHGEQAARERIGEIARVCRESGAAHVEVATGPDEELRLWRLRHAASPILNRLAPRYQNLQLVEDGCVPPPRFADYVRGVRAALDRQGLRGVIFGHAGDAHAHVNALVDVTEGDWRTRCERLVDEVTDLVARLGGTLAGEHGDGRLRAPLLSKVWPAGTLALFAATKRAFDPDGILNPGVKVAAPDAHGLGAIKYDPTLSALPAEARAVLDLVVREKAWGRTRLELLDEL